MSSLAGVLAFERELTRRVAFLALIAAAVISPDIAMPDDLPAIRLEQVLLAFLLPSFALYALRNPGVRRAVILDYAFLALAVAITVSIVFAPLVVDEAVRTLRDPFEIARVVEYWLLARLAMTLSPEPAARWAVGALAVSALGLTGFSLVQYLHPGRFNFDVTDIWAVENNVLAIERRGRVVGTIGNANYYGLFCGLTLAVGLGVLLLRERRDGLWWLAAAGSAASAVSVVLSQSRTATGALVAALALGLAYVVATRRREAAYGPAVGLFCVSVAVAILFVELVPPRFGSFHQRFNLDELGEDYAVTTRLSRWRSLFAGFSDDEGPGTCQSIDFAAATPAGGHAPSRRAAGAGDADAAIKTRDAVRKSDVAAIATAVLDYSCARGEWPAAASLEGALVPEFLEVLPHDQGRGVAYLYYTTSAGFFVGAALEDLSDPEGPNYTLGTLPSIVSNSSFERGGGGLSGWTATAGASAGPATDGLFGERAARVVYSPIGNPADRGSLVQVLVAPFAPGKPYTVGAWVKNESSTEQFFQIYLIAVDADGRITEPFLKKKFPLPPNREWYPASLTFNVPGGAPLSELKLLLRAPTAEDEPAQGEVTFVIDGVTLTPGPLALSYPHTRDADPATLPASGLPQFSDSPLIGVGPRKDYTQAGYDNEYALFLDRFGILGTAAYVFLLAAAGLGALRAVRPDRSMVSALSMGVLTFTVGMAIFNIAAGSFYHFQIMAVYWLLAGLTAGAVPMSQPVEAAAPGRAAQPATTAPGRKPGHG